MAKQGRGGGPRGLRPKTLQEASEVIDVILDTDPSGIFIYSEDGRLVDCNRAACTMHGFSKEEMLGMSPKDFIHPDGYQTFVDFQAELQSRGWFRGESCGITADGEKFDVEVFGQPVVINGTGYLYSTIRDITEAKANLAKLLEYERELERKVEERTAALERSNAQLEQFAYLTSHDLQEPLRTINGCAQVLAEDYGETLDEGGRRTLEYIRSGSRRMGQMIVDLLEHSRLGTETKIEEVDCNAVLEDVLADMRDTLQAASARVDVGPLPTLRGRPTEIRLLFQNLIANAVKFRRDEPPHIRVTAQPADAGWSFRVADNGIGIAPKNVDKVFGVFARLHRKEQYEGSGIGLAHCRKIVQQHGGSIRMESTPSQGTTVIFDLVEARASDAGYARAVKAVEVPARHGATTESPNG